METEESRGSAKCRRVCVVRHSVAAAIAIAMGRGRNDGYLAPVIDAGAFVLDCT